jgi:putative Mg2+ transporter-C (MgtC) family protein
MTFPEFALAVGSALLAGVAIGLERQCWQHPAGLRTNALVCVGAAAFVTISQLVGDPNGQTRMASYVVSGIGFLGGGVILREGMTVKGMNTAATLWCTAAVGALCGSGFVAYGLAIAGTVLGINVVLRPVAHWINAHRHSASEAGTVYRLQVVCLGRDAAAVRDALLRHVGGHTGLSIHGVSSQPAAETGAESIAAEVVAARADDQAMGEVMNRLNGEPGVRSVRWDRRAAEGQG